MKTEPVIAAEYILKTSLYVDAASKAVTKILEELPSDASFAVISSLTGALLTQITRQYGQRGLDIARASLTHAMNRDAENSAKEAAALTFMIACEKAEREKRHVANG